MEINFFIKSISLSSFNKPLTSTPRDKDRCLCVSINLKVMIVLLKLLIEKIKNVSLLLEIQLIFELGHLSAKYDIINLKSNLKFHYEIILFIDFFFLYIHYV